MLTVFGFSAWLWHKRQAPVLHTLAIIFTIMGIIIRILAWDLRLFALLTFNYIHERRSRLQIHPVFVKIPPKNPECVRVSSRCVLEFSVLYDFDH